MKNQKSKLKREYSAAGVVYKKHKQEVWFLLGKHSGYHKWALPKGLIEKGERSWQTIVRETEEEMGVKARLVFEKPIHKDSYFYWADLKKPKAQNEELKVKDAKKNKDTRRVEKYQEQGGGKTKIFKTVTFYLLEYVSGDPKDHGWEMEEAGWFDYKKALEMMSFDGEKEALKRAREILIET